MKIIILMITYHPSYFIVIFVGCTDNIHICWLKNTLKGPYFQNFILCIYVILHKTTIVQNKIITYLFLPFFVWLIFIGHLGKVQLGRPKSPNPKIFESLNYLRRK